MTNKPILCDLDDVVFCLREPMSAALNAVTGKNISFLDWSDFEITSFYGISLEDFYRTLEDHRCIEKALPELGAREALQRLSAAGRRIVMVTSRGWHPHGVRVTKDALCGHDIPHDDLIVVPKGRKKSDMYRELAPTFDCLIDDHVANLDDAKQSGIVDKTWMISRPWNLKYSHHDRTDSLKELASTLLAR